MSDNNTTSDRIFILTSETLHHLERVEEVIRTMRRVDHEAAEDLATINLHRAYCDLTRAIGALIGSFAEPPEPSENIIRPMGVAA